MKRLLLIISTCFIYHLSLAQDPQFTQFFNSPIYTNPAFAGSALYKDESFASRLNLIYRNQWPNLRGTYQTLNLSWDKQMRRGGALGFQLLRDVAGSGLLTTTAPSFIYAHGLDIDEDISIRGGVQFSFVRKTLDFNKLQFADQIDPTQGFVLKSGQPLPNQEVSFANLGAGIITYIHNIHIGFAFHNILEPNQSFYGNQDAILPQRITIHTGGRFNVFESLKWESSYNPNVLFMVQQNFSQILLNSNLCIGRATIGAGFRQTLGTFGNADAVIGYIGYNSSCYTIMYSYDYTVSSARFSAVSSHEFSMQYLIPIKKYEPNFELRSPSY